VRKQESVERGKQLIEELSGIVKQLPDDEFLELLGTGSLDGLLTAILDPSESVNFPNLNEFLLAKKARATLLATLHYAITRNYAFAGRTSTGEGFISPNRFQWFDDGILFLQGKKPFAGLLGLYRSDGSLSYAVVARDIRGGETISAEDFEFIDEAATRELFKTQASNLDEPIQRLQLLLDGNDNDESHYQELLIEYPWIFGAEYKKVQRHTTLDDRNIPDFTGVRVHDSCRDIIEIKPPFTKMFKDDGNLSANFNDAWNQIEKYKDFADRQKDYLYSEKGLLFDNPKCYLILGFDLTNDELAQIRRKERINPVIHLRTNNDLLALAKNTVALIRTLKNQEKPSDT
jgi:hypothetical protein